MQLDEPIKEKTNKEPYDFVKNELKKEPTIFEIAAERLRRAGAKIEQTQKEKPQELAQEISTLDTGFKICFSSLKTTKFIQAQNKISYLF